MRLHCLLFFVCINQFIFANHDTLAPNSRRIKILSAATITGYTFGVLAMNQLWYKNQPKSSFHTFNDIHEWKQVDKAGHLYTAYNESKLAMHCLMWAGISQKKAAILGALAGFAFQLPIEVMDGFVSSYGASLSDLGANAIGSTVLAVQMVGWNEEKFFLKFSFHPTKYAPLRPSVLGSHFAQEIFKDYNGQTYWLSWNLHSFGISKRMIPQWLNVAIGYGSQGMIFANMDSGSIKRYRQYYLALDLNLSKIATRKKAIRILLDTINIIHIPSPAIEINKHQIKFHPIYF